MCSSDLAKVRIKYLTGGTQVEIGNISALLWGVDHWRPKNAVRGEQVMQPISGAGRHHFVPAIYGIRRGVCHLSFLSARGRSVLTIWPGSGGLSWCKSCCAASRISYAC